MSLKTMMWGMVAATAFAPNIDFAQAVSQKQQLLNYIAALSGQTRHILIGQHASYWSTDPMDYQKMVLKQTGKDLAIMGFPVGDPTMQPSWVKDAQAWLAKGGIPMLSMWAVSPINGAGSQSAKGDISQLLPGGSANAKWNSYIDGIAGQIKQLNGPAFFRPFLEMNGNWFWWGASTPATFIQVWQYTYDRLVVTDGVTNLVWVYSPNDGYGNYTAYYPGDAYADVVGLDGYAPSSDDAQAWAALGVIKKPQFYAETGVFGPDNSKVKLWGYSNYTNVLAAVTAVNPNVFAVVYFCQNWGLPMQKDAKKVMSDPSVITLSDLGKVWQ